MDRFHIIVSNYKHIYCFVDNFYKIKNFNPKRDRIYILDCSPEDAWQKELQTAKQLINQNLEWRKNLFFIRRRNWAGNFGSVLDYYYWLLQGSIPPVQYNFFMQEHYLDTQRYVNVDTIPSGYTFDLDEIEELFLSDTEIACAFSSRVGIRISVCQPNLLQAPPQGKEEREFSAVKNQPDQDQVTYYLPTLGKDEIRQYFFTDGGNFLVRPEPFINYFYDHPNQLIEGNGSFGFSVVWEERLGKILCDLGIKWADLYHKVVFRDFAELDAIEAKLGKSVSGLWHEHMNWIIYYGHDLLPDHIKFRLIIPFQSEF